MYRSLLFTTLLVVVPCLPGCTVYQNAHRTIIEEPARFSWKRDRVRSRQLYYQWADEAWRTGGRAAASCESPTYLTGFREGFADYVYAGGNGEPPAVPPRECWNADLRNERGQTLADLWFAGYRHGVAMAREGGFRGMVVVRSSLLTDEMGHGGPHTENHPEPFEVYESQAVPYRYEPELVTPGVTDDDSISAPPAGPPPIPHSPDDPGPSRATTEEADPFLDDAVDEVLPDMSSRARVAGVPIAQAEFRQSSPAGDWKAAGTVSRDDSGASVPLIDASPLPSPFSSSRPPENPFLR